MALITVIVADREDFPVRAQYNTLRRAPLRGCLYGFWHKIYARSQLAAQPADKAGPDRPNRGHTKFTTRSACVRMGSSERRHLIQFKKVRGSGGIERGLSDVPVRQGRRISLGETRYLRWKAVEKLLGWR